MLKDKIECNGCGACFNICPKNAITMQANVEGFLEPVINKEKCTDCGLCERICRKLYDKNNDNPACYAVMAKDSVRLSGSSSGAIFPVIAAKILSHNGYVCGAAFNKDWKVEHVIIDDISKLPELQGSKYVQSDTNTCFKQVKTLLEENKKVLFTGTPCQIGGLRNFLNKNYENLICIDIVCHGTPSPKVLEKYLNENFDKKLIATINHRSKLNGWNQLYTTTTTTTTTGNFIAERSHTDDYLKAFLYNLSIRKSCFECKYQAIPRQGDLTIGDFWGIGEYKPEYNDEKGTSLLLINNEKGAKLAEEIKHEFKLFEEVPLDVALKGNPNLTGSSKPHKNRDLFFENLDKMTLKENLDYTFNEKADCILLNLWFCVNYGALLTCYGLKKFLENNGLKTQVANYVHENFQTMVKDFFPMEFAKKHLDLTQECKTYTDLQKLNEKTDTFIVGSDQLWKSSIYKSHGGYIYHLNFVDGNKKKIAYSVSFGDDKFDGDYEDTKLSQHYLNQFDAVSVRENNGVKILKETFNLEGTQLLDPVFAITSEEWNEIANKENTLGDYIAYYSLACGWYNDDIPYIKDFVKYAETKLNLNSVSLRINKKYSVEQWLSYIKNSKFVITDSYHGVCFAIIYNKPFVFINTNRGGNDRFDTLFSKLNIKNRTIYHNDNFEGKDYLFEDIDYTEINKILESERLRSQKWLQNAIKQPLKPKSSETEILNILLNKQFSNDIKTYFTQTIKPKLNFFEKIFSIKNLYDLANNKKRKMITILGIKIKIK